METRNLLSLSKENKKGRNLDYIFFLILIFGFIIAIVGFWDMETILWNRIKYTTGSLWANSNPIYMLTPLSDIIVLLSKDVIYYILGNILIYAATGLLIFQYLIKKNWFNTSKTYLILVFLFNVVAAILGFWINGSIGIIDGLPAYNGTASGNEWLNGQIPSISTLLLSSSYFFWISFIVTSGICLVTIIRYRKVLGKKAEELIEEEIDKNLDSGEEAKKNYRYLFFNFLKNIFRNIPFYFILFVYLLFTLFPVFLALRASVSNIYEINAGLDPHTPINSMILNYSSVMFAVSVDEASFQSALFNSVFIGFGTSIFGLAISLTSAYGLARFDFKGKTILSFLILSTQMFPAIILLIPQYVIISDLGLLAENAVLFGVLLVMSTTSTAYVTWMMKGYFETIPRDIEEAAYIDGYGKFRTFIKIVIPLAKSGMVAVMVFTFLSAWQEFVLANTFIRYPSRFTLPLLFYNYQDLNQPDSPTFFELLSPYAILVAAPVVAFYLVLQKQLVGGVIAGSVK